MMNRAIPHTKLILNWYCFVDKNKYEKFSINFKMSPIFLAEFSSKNNT